MKRRIILLLEASVLIIVGSSMANGAEDILEEIFPSMVESGEEIVQSENVFLEENSLSSGQTLTDIDSGGVLASGLDITGYENLPLSGELNGFELSTGSFEPPTQYHLFISEVYFDGTDEWIEITNIGDGNFLGNFTLVGVKSTSLALSNISLLAGESKVFGDNLSQISGTTYIGKTGLSLNLIDTAPINIQLNISGQREDSFLVDTYRVNQYNDKKTSFEKVGGVSTWTTSGRIFNAQSGYTINPGTYFSNGIVTNISLPPIQSGDNFQLPISCALVDQSGLIKINEIFLGNENYPPYIELSISDDITISSLSLSGNLLGKNVSFSLDNGVTTLQKNTLLLLSSTGFRKNQEGLSSVRNDDFTLVSTGNRLLITIGSGQNGQVMDIVYSSGNTLGSSWYYRDTSQQCVRVLDAMDEFSPGFERKFLKYISGRTAPIIEYVYLSTGNQATSGACLGIATGTQSTGIITPVLTGFIPQNYTISIVDVEYDPEGSDTNNEKITLLATNISGDTTPLDLSKIFRIKVNGTNKTLPRILPINTNKTFTKTFGFPNSTKDGSEVVIQLTYGEYIFDTYTYNPNLPKEEVLTGDLEYTGVDLDLSGLQFTISYVLPNPVGKDIAEEIGITIFSNEAQRVATNPPSASADSSPFIKGVNSGFDLSQGFTLRRESTKKKLFGFVYGGQENILSGNLGLVNKAACVSLFYHEVELDTFCYPTPKEGQKIYASYSSFEEVTQENLDIFNALTLKRVERDMCVFYEGASFLCKRFPASKAETKTVNEKNLYKGFSSLVKNYLMTDWKTIYYDTDIKQYFDLLTKSKNLIAQGFSDVDIYGQSVSVTSIKQQLEVIEKTPPVVVALFEGIEILLQ